MNIVFSMNEIGKYGVERARIKWMILLPWYKCGAKQRALCLACKFAVKLLI